MPLRPPRSLEELTDLRAFSRWCDQTIVEPSDGTVTADALEDGSITTPKLADLAVTSAKLDTGAVGTVKMADNAVDNTKLRDSPGTSVIGRSAGTTGDPGNITAANDDEVLVRRAGVLTFDALDEKAITATGTYTGAFTGTTTDPAPTLRYSIAGTLVTLYIPQASATSNATGFTITGAPVAIRPARTQTVLARVQDNGAVSIGTASMSTAGTLTLGLGVTGGAFTNSGTKGVELQTLTYSLD